MNWLQGGSHMAEATVQPDYKIGPEISEKISRLAMVIRAANNGIVIAENSPLEKFLKCDSIVFDDSVAWQVAETGQQTFAGAAHQQGFAEVLFFAARSKNHAANLASRLGFDSFRGNGSEESKRTYIEERQKQGHSVIYVGDCETESAAAEQADVAISVLDLSSEKQINKFSIALLSPDLVKILQLRTIVLRAVNEFKLGSGLSLAPNLAAVFSALSLGSPTSMAVLLTNLGMLTTYIRSGLILHQAEREYRTGA
jgi:cation transport ATPase